MAEGEQPNVYHPESGSNAGKWILTAVAVAFVAATAFFGYDTHNKLTKLTEDQTASQQQIADLTKRMQSAESDAETLGQKIGMTKKELAERAEELQRAQAASAAKLSAQEKQDVTAVAGEVGSVKTDVGGVKSDVAATKATLDSTIAKLQSTIGDLGQQSGLIANTRSDLEALPAILRVHAGERGEGAADFDGVDAAEEDRSQAW